MSALEGFSPIALDWFRGAFAAPTAAQEGAWTAAQAGRHALVVAPTGSGKTLAAFLWALDRLALPYFEQPHIPLLHRLPTTRHGGRGVPVLLHAGRCLTDSTDILVHADAQAGGDDV